MNEDPKDESASQFERQAGEKQPSFFVEFGDFLIHNKKWWLTPIMIVLLLFTLLAILTSSPAIAPFIYPAW